MTISLRSRLGSVALLCLLCWSCSENLGLAPPDGGRRVGVRAEAGTGPERPRAVLSLATSADRMWVGCDAGLFAADPLAARATWSAVHAGFLGADAFERIARVDAVATDATGQLLLHLGRVTPVLSLAASRDGGRTHTRLGIPDPVLEIVGEIGVIGLSAAWPQGGWIVQQGVQVFIRDAGSDAWETIALPSTPQSVRRVRATIDGRVAILVDLGVSDAVWVVPRSGPRTAVEVARVPHALIDALPDAGDWLLAHADGIDRADGTSWLRWPDHQLEQITLTERVGGARWAMVGRAAAGGAWIALGSGPGEVSSGSLLGGEPVEGTLESAGEHAAVAVRNAGHDEIVVARVVSTSAPQLTVQPARFTELDARAVAVLDAVDGVIAVGSEFSGEVFAGPSVDPSAFEQLGIGPLASIVTALVDDDQGRVLAGSFGVHRFDPLLRRWETVNDGQFTYQPGDFGGPVVVRSLARGHDGLLWLGADNGDGVYRGADVPGIGLVWERLHEGFGAPGSFAAEFGLPLVTQARAFAEDAESRIWMGGFRGGAWFLDPATEVWMGANEGLPDLMGAPFDTCCVQAGGREVDVRDLTALGDGTLLAATAWGVFARAPGSTRWQERSLGLSNRDIFALAAHPRRDGTVVAGASSGILSGENREQWLFLSEDGARTWFPVDVAQGFRDCIGMVWSRPDRMEIVALLRARGAVRVELAP